MSEYRPVLDPDILDRITVSIETIKRAWQSDVDRLRIAEDRLVFTERQLQISTERVEGLRADVAQMRVDNHDLLKRNAHLEAQLCRVYDNSIDAEESLRTLRDRAVDAVRTAPAMSDTKRPVWREPEKQPPGDDDGTGLPPGAPLIFQRPGPSTERLPINEFGRHEVGGGVA
jgi:hypothetical protein